MGVLATHTSIIEWAMVNRPALTLVVFALVMLLGLWIVLRRLTKPRPERNGPELRVLPMDLQVGDLVD
jgi:hypothetical protein